jgi:hypothetical protein
MLALGLFKADKQNVTFQYLQTMVKATLSEEGHIKYEGKADHTHLCSPWPT